MFYSQVKGLCEENHIAISTLARKLGLSPSAPNKWLEGTYPKAETIMKIAEHFDVSTDYLLYGGERTHNSLNAGKNIGKTAISDVSGPATFQWNEGGTVTVQNQSGASDLSGIDAELMKIIMGLDMLSKTKLFQMAYEMAEANKEKTKE